VGATSLSLAHPLPLHVHHPDCVMHVAHIRLGPPRATGADACSTMHGGELLASPIVPCVRWTGRGDGRTGMEVLCLSGPTSFPQQASRHNKLVHPAAF
jgi:hypothetical protein